MNIEDFLKLNEKKRLEHLVEWARAMFQANDYEGIVFWLNFYSTMKDFQTGRANRQK